MDSNAGDFFGNFWIKKKKQYKKFLWKKIMNFIFELNSFSFLVQFIY